MSARTLWARQVRRHHRGRCEGCGKPGILHEYEEFAPERTELRLVDDAQCGSCGAVLTLCRKCELSWDGPTTCGRCGGPVGGLMDACRAFPYLIGAQLSEDMKQKLTAVLSARGLPPPGEAK